MNENRRKPSGSGRRVENERPRTSTVRSAPAHGAPRKRPEQSRNENRPAAKGGEQKPAGASGFFWKDKGQRARNIFFVLTLVSLMVIVAVSYVSAKLDIIGGNDDPEVNISSLEKLAKVDKIYDDEELVKAPGVTDAHSFTDFSYKWATNGAPLRSSKNVINILLLGIDGADALENGGRSDTMILCSINKKEKKIFLTSFYRDTWTYMNVGGVETYTKMNAAYVYGKDAGIVATIENNFKIDVDYYLAVDFSSFEDIINLLGGITVDVEEYEAQYIRRTSVHKEFPSGQGVKLNGWEALVFARIRKSDGDSDVSRTRRQRIVISALIDSVKGASLSKINEMVDTFFSYVRTDISKMEILSYAVSALANDWADFDIESVMLNDESIYRTGRVGDSSVVFVEFPAVSELVQNAVYGDSSVSAADSQKVFDFLRRGGSGEWTF